jgi:hypothetical protein
MVSCPGTGLFAHLSGAQRQWTFWYVCIPTRIVLSLLVALTVGNVTWIQTLVTVGSALAVIINLTRLDGTVWWSRMTHLVLAAMVLVASRAAIDWVAPLIWLDIALGIMNAKRTGCPG